MIHRAISTLPIFASTLALHVLSDGRAVVSLRRPFAASVTLHQRMVVHAFVRTESIEFYDRDGRQLEGRDADAVLDIARSLARAALRDDAGFYADLAPVAIDLAVELGRRWKVAS